ncbi:MAG TPA: hypothetical protein VFK35_07530 [Candidatus Limnocylindrales bacterium]|nr:hypothetical protein [Candidatus Limnocylindrales bacterium]
MFSTLIGALPDAQGGSHDDAVTALAAAGLELVSDGRAALSPGVEEGEAVARWEAAALASPVPVKAVLVGPFTAARHGASSPEAAAEALQPVIVALAAAGCPIVEVVESDVVAIAVDASARTDFVAAHRRLLDGSVGIHASLTLTGGDLDSAGPATFFDLGYASFAFDLIAGPDNWRLVTHAPPDRGIICGALDPRPGGDESRELLVWAAHYAAASNGRGLARVGLANASPFVGVPRAEALRKLRIVADAARVAGIPSAEERARHLDPRAVDARSAALGRVEPKPRRRR